MSFMDPYRGGTVFSLQMLILYPKLRNFLDQISLPHSPKQPQHHISSHASATLCFAPRLADASSAIGRA